MKRACRLLLIPAIVAALFMFSTVRPVSAGTCVVWSGPLAVNEISPTFSPPAGHTYQFVWNGTVSGSYSFTTPLALINNSSGPVNVAVYDLSGNCSAVTFFNPGDGRVAGLAGDRVVVYCNTNANPPTLDVWGVTNDSQGHRLFTFTYADLLKAGAKGILKKVEPLGSVSAVVDANNNFVVQWFGGPAGATGAKDFAKSLSCNFAK